MSRSRRLTWIAFALCVLLVIDVFVWISIQTLRLERLEHEARTRAQLNERVRLALWRMDSTIAPIVAAEAARPPSHYRAFFDPLREWSPEAVEPGRELRASPLLVDPPRLIRLHYEVRPNGSIASPQVPEGAFADLALREHLTTPRAITRARLRLIELEQLLADRPGTARTPAPVQTPDESPGLPDEGADFEARRQVFEEAVSVAESVPKAVPGKSEQPSAARLALSDRSDGPFRARDTAAQIVQTLFAPRWVQSPSSGSMELLFERTIRVGDARFVQGFWVDWPALRAELLSRVVDLLPQGDLVPAPVGGQRLLAAIPASLVPSSLPAPSAPLLTPARQTLLVSWIAVLVAIGAIALVLRAATRLSDRRGRFVAAVTHELRTPITTFRLYSDLLAADTLDDAKRRVYVERLREQTTRLSRIVESVLAYARLDRRRIRAVPVRTEEIIERICRASPERPEVRMDAGASDAMALCDLDAVERIILNLLDNARKYAPGAPLWVEIGADAQTVSVRVRDLGPGVAPDHARRIFGAFERGMHAGSSDAPGLGLGLSLARELARAMGGELRLVPVDGPGACFELVLRRARGGARGTRAPHAKEDKPAPDRARATDP